MTNYQVATSLRLGQAFWGTPGCNGGWALHAAARTDWGLPLGKLPLWRIPLGSCHLGKYQHRLVEIHQDPEYPHMLLDKSQHRFEPRKNCIYYSHPSTPSLIDFKNKAKQVLYGYKAQVAITTLFTKQYSAFLQKIV